MNILRVIASMNPAHGGPAQGIRNSIPALEQLGVHNEVLCFDAPDASFVKDDGFAIHTIGPAKGPYAYCKNLKVWLQHNLHRFDAIIIHGLWLYNSYGTYLALKSYKIQNGTVPKLFVMPHGMLDPYFQKAAGRRLKAIRNWLFWKLIERHVVNYADGLLFTCEQELLLARETFDSYHPKRELNISYGIQSAPRYSVKLTHAFHEICTLLFNQPYWLFLSRIHEKKGVDLLIKAYLKLSKETSNLPALVIAGPGLDTTYGKEIVALAQSTNQILFTGMLTGDAKWGGIYGCEAFILPSHQENFGIAIAEAMACEKPVLISDKVNIWREIKTGGGGLVDTDTEGGVYAMLTHWFHLTQAEKKTMAASAKRTYEAFFTMEKAAIQMIEALKSV
ncbi:glycosyltransferase [Parapedobacter koreensis]|uniref:Glycosyltransferase involved in cell wall bisynthesis n=1 Tax=Parapedobacter koreensis TaxID=332977 RepID=A0A1H7NMT2_9SPHI|nr:glycosyltransferase [Parapedobacter koreensis]SEL24776.1 Glycosyltransferase involved in cell wall bisynthesis [Parapedobacter koreensis]